ncbi:hypothetical protein A2454_03370 [Candidatus Peribacteria bacterium RIFOXYC2_FULL_55_14]|nr:MAG: hypothetical protein UY90_C0093G0007 [Candidatus Peregrinibacteria bacterium GW2011_GWA2_54_9]OGJ71204.1 MAG: hypothetical protein A2198_01745 [Candidatus Peribacteria bacterium RIFOXYA1_FULL_56_14]OGJ73839.1 MAG: hypothetical protein A2384_04690 [Candidatus Peribacteria bacterium RIFOXYB1_FULL_54_35]OGJ74967.1 MAG: hypothetical protein A2217_03160 [Candidatus Peribacteria bacterium RIFOXYA2_FULL_55_28]OGJ77254.1 MAG: hypothetical protein A2327_06265 [Candidatus Peribacteria bacterium R
MCTRSSLVFREDGTRQRRIAMLQAWIAEDLAHGDEALGGALTKWRDEILTRLHTRRPLIIRIPELFVRHLGLSNQRVLINESHEVLEVVSRNGRKTRNAQTGRVIVPAQV